MCDLGSSDIGQHWHILHVFTSSSWSFLIFQTQGIKNIFGFNMFQHICVFPYLRTGGIKFPAQVSALASLADEAKRRLAEFRDAKQSWA